MKVHGYLGASDTVRLYLQKAILIYASGGGDSSVATVHDVRLPEQGRPELCPGSPLTRAALQEMVEMLLSNSDAPARRELVPEHLLYAEATRLLWWKPRHRAPIFFRSGRKAFDENVNGKLVEHPPLLFLATSGRLNLWALKEDRRPTLETPLFQAPYFNIYGGGGMCVGNVRLPEVLRPSAIQGFEEGFFSTNFTHSNVPGKPLTGFPGGHDALWTMLADSDSAFPTDSLIPSGSPATLGDALNQRAPQ